MAKRVPWKSRRRRSTSWIPSAPVTAFRPRCCSRCTHFRGSERARCARPPPANSAAHYPLHRSVRPSHADASAPIRRAAPTSRRPCLNYCWTKRRSLTAACSGLWKILAHGDFGGVGGRQHRLVEDRLRLGDDVVQGNLLDRLGQQLPDAVGQRAVVNQIWRLASEPLVVQGRPLLEVGGSVIGDRKA